MQTPAGVSPMGSRADRAEQRTESRMAREQRRAEKGQQTVGILSTLTGRTWERPTFEMPMLTPERDLTFLGTDRGGRRWFAHKRYGELVEGRTVDATRQELPNSVLVEIDHNTFRLFGNVSAPGTFERLTNTVDRPVRPPKPHRPVDALGHLFLTAPRPERIAASPQAVTVRAAEDQARGPAAILERLSRAGATVRLSTDRLDLVVTTSGGILGAGVLELIDRAGPLLVAHLNGEPLACTVSKHKGSVLATTFALGGAPWCGDCGGAS